MSDEPLRQVIGTGRPRGCSEVHTLLEGLRFSAHRASGQRLHLLLVSCSGLMKYWEDEVELRGAPLTCKKCIQRDGAT